MAIIAIVLTSTIAFTACGVATPTTRHSGYIQNGSTVVLDFDITTRTHAQYLQIRQAWNDAAVSGNSLATNQARAALAFVPNAQVGWSGMFSSITGYSFSEIQLPIQARTQLSVNMFGEPDWRQADSGQVGNELSQGQGFYITNTASTPFQYDFGTVTQIALLMGLPNHNDIITINELNNAINQLWNADDIYLSEPVRTNARVANRRYIINRVNQHFITSEMLALGYELAMTDSQLTSTHAHWPLRFFYAGGTRVSMESFFVQRHLRFSLNGNPRVYLATGTIDNFSLEMEFIGSWNADGSSFAHTVFVLAGVDNHQLRPMVRAVNRVMLDVDAASTLMSSSYINGQVHSISLTAFNDEGVRMADRFEMEFIINR